MATSSARVTRIAAVLTCYNRRETTLRCLASLAAAARADVRIDVFVCDDASSDGTAESVRANFPDVRIVGGTGDLFWCGGMRAAMRAAAEIEHDFLLWLNDDVDLSPDFLTTLLDAQAMATAAGPGPHVIVGAVLNPVSGALTYSGFRRLSAFHPAKFERVMPTPGALQPSDTMNGNCVLFPAALVRDVGEIDPAYSQQIGDADYGYRCVQRGAKLWVAPEPVGTCAPNTRWLRWSNPELSLWERLAVLNTPHGLPPAPWLHFMWRFGGMTAVVLLGTSYVKWLVLSAFKPQRRVN